MEQDEKEMKTKGLFSMATMGVGMVIAASPLGDDAFTSVTIGFTLGLNAALADPETAARYADYLNGVMSEAGVPAKCLDGKGLMEAIKADLAENGL